MANCQSCGIEVIGWERFCRNCGAPAAVSAADLPADLVDTHRMNPQAVPTATGHLGTTNQLYYAPMQAAYGVAQDAASSHRTAPFLTTLIQRKVFWLLLVLMLCGLTAAGIAIGRATVHMRQVEEAQGNEEDSDIASQELEEVVQNALGFKHGSVSDARLTDVEGIFVNHLMTDDSPAARAKIQAGDVITKLNDQTVSDEGELSTVLDSLKAGDEVPVTIYRDGAIISTRIKVADRNFPPLMPKIEIRDQGFLGIKDSVRRCCIPGTKKWGVEIQEMFENSPADIFGLKVGDVITEFNDRLVRTPNEFNRLIRAVSPRSKVKVEFYRGSTVQKVELILGHRWEGTDGEMRREHR